MKEFDGKAVGNICIFLQEDDYAKFEELSGECKFSGNTFPKTEKIK